ncbi:MAG: alginate export family protein [Bryobacterales bacterium]|nr:alginate export family protein [Bryobacteraceae bacterium]MDW8131884.1 alginate export family protein [Bryobacterales bacterium]
MPPSVRSLPSWLKLGAELRGRAEWWAGIGHEPGANDACYLHRLRLRAAVEPAAWLGIFLEAQDARALGLSRRAQAGVVNTLDLRLGYLELGRMDRDPLAVRLGRQELRFGAERLVGTAGWGNVTRTFDAVRVAIRGGGLQTDVFAAAVVHTVHGRFDRPRLQGGLYGVWLSSGRVLREATLEPYLFWKTAPGVRGERGDMGDMDLWTAGIRASGRWRGGRLDYELETAVQWGSAGSDAVRAWAGHWMAAVPLTSGSPSRLLVEYSFASGDRDRGDGRRGTFDQLYPSNHPFYGIADRIGWRNIHDVSGGLEWRPDRRWRLRLECHSFWLADRRDALYTEAGVEFVRNPQATSSRVGWELDFQAEWQYSEHLRLGVGWARFFSGPFLKQSTPGGPFSYPYLLWEYRF